MRAVLRAIEYHLPDHVLGNDDLAGEFRDWSASKIEAKTGIRRRHIAREDECASDLAFCAAKKLFTSGACRAEEIDYLLLCTQSPDYFLPTTACVLQHRLGLATNAGALDFNLGCSGYVYGLGLAKGLVATGQARNVLLITAETYSKFMHRADHSVRTLFGDAAAATFVQAAEEAGGAEIGDVVYGTDGAGAQNLIVPAGGLRHPRSAAPTGHGQESAHGSCRSGDNLYMNGPKIFAFTLRAVPQIIERLLTKSGIAVDQVDFFVFHQANGFMLEHLRKKMAIPRQKFCVAMADCGNTVSSTIPIALKHATGSGDIQPGMTVMLVGFGVGYSWGAALVKW